MYSTAKDCKKIICKANTIDTRNRNRGICFNVLSILINQWTLKGGTPVMRRDAGEC